MNDKTKACVARKVKSGEFASPEAVYDAGIEDLRREEEAALAAMRQDVDIGLEDARAGRFSGRTVMQIARDIRKEMQGATNVAVSVKSV
ncbi:MAG: hypothetical protein O2910_02630 [Proteobacteria bacterium]|nr:hypothetical protein [Pseudomonadota bacterium]